LRLVVLLLLGCAHEEPWVEPVGWQSRPYTTLPAYLQHPIAEHDLGPSERLQQMTEVLRDIDARAGTLPEGGEDLKLRVHELGELVPPTPEMLVPVERMKLVLDDMPRKTPEDTRRALWALTDLIRLRAHF
jgi:hypothetical protein